MKNCRNTIGQDVKSARHQIPVTLSRTGLTVFPRSNGVDVSLEKLVAVICRNLIFYQIQRMCSKNADEQNNVSPAFSAYSDKMRHFLHNSDCLELYLCDKSSEMNSTDTKRIWEKPGASAQCIGRFAQRDPCNTKIHTTFEKSLQIVARRIWFRTLPIASRLDQLAMQ